MEAERKNPLPFVETIMNRVYSPYTGPSWIPQAFEGQSRRYLWSDAFGVCNYISLYYAHHEATRYLDQADALIQDVHEELGFHRRKKGEEVKIRLDDSTDTHPTKGGLRIGKEEEKEDGQYFHYLTKWMFALNRMSMARKHRRYNDWAIELAKVAHRYFVVKGIDGRPLRMVWKRSVDLQHVKVSNEGNLDAFDGWAIYSLLQRTSYQKCVLKMEIDDMTHLIDRRLSTITLTDELDSGEALWLAKWNIHEPWAQTLFQVAMHNIERLFVTGKFNYSSTHRLLFREMGMVLGLQIAISNSRMEEKEKWQARIDQLLSYWCNQIYDRDTDISPLMYVAALVPGVMIQNLTEQ